MKDDLKNVFDSLVHMAASENEGKSTVVVRVWSDGTCDLEHYVNGEEIGEYGVRRRRTRMVEGVKVEQIIKGVNDLWEEEWTEGRVQAPQDAREQVRDMEVAAQTAMEALAGFLMDVPGASRTRPDLVVAHDALAAALGVKKAREAEEGK